MEESQVSASLAKDQRSGHSAKRSRTGCAGCRRRKIKCDERLPTCTQCQKSGRECDSSSRLFRQHESSFSIPKPRMTHRRLSSLSYTSSADSRSPDAVWVNVPRQVVFVDENAPRSASPNEQSWSDQVSITNQSIQDIPRSHSTTAEDAFHHERWPSDVHHSVSGENVYTNSTTNPTSHEIERTELRSSPSHESEAPTRGPVSQNISSRPIAELERRPSERSILIPVSSNASNEVQQDIESSHEISFFLRHYSETPAMWMDLFDLDYYYSRQVPILALHNPLVRYSACAFAAKQLGRVRGAKAQRGGVASRLSVMETWHHHSDADYIWHGAKYYDKAISLLMDQISNVNHGERSQLSSHVATGENDSMHSANSLSPDVSRNNVHFRDSYNRRFNDETMVAATILCNYEFLSATTQGWSGHLDGTRSLLQLTDEEGIFQFQPSPRPNSAPPNPPKVLRSTFWNFARQDFLASLIHRKHTRLDPHNLDIWRAMGLVLDDDGLVISNNLPEHTHPPGVQPMREDMISNALVWLLSKIVNFIASSSQDTNALEANNIHSSGDGMDAATWSRLNHELDKWFEGLPPTFKPSARISINGNVDFTRTSSNISAETWFSNSMCASTMQSYHMARILLLIHRPTELLARVSGQSRDLLRAFRDLNNQLRSHAIEICSISLSRPDDATRIHSLQPLYMAGRCLTDSRDREIAVNLIRDIEKDLGWATQYRVDQLIEEWGAGENESMQVHPEETG